jgi:hypothetical protein
MRSIFHSIVQINQLEYDKTEILKDRTEPSQNAPRDLDKLELVLMEKEKRGREKGKYIFSIERLLAEIEALKVTLWLVYVNKRSCYTITALVLQH